MQTHVKLHAQKVQTNVLAAGRQLAPERMASSERS